MCQVFERSIGVHLFMTLLCKAYGQVSSSVAWVKKFLLFLSGHLTWLRWGIRRFLFQVAKLEKLIWQATTSYGKASGPSFAARTKKPFCHFPSWLFIRPRYFLACCIRARLAQWECWSVGVSNLVRAKTRKNNLVSSQQEKHKGEFLRFEDTELLCLSFIIWAMVKFVLCCAKIGTLCMSPLGFRVGWYPTKKSCGRRSILTITG